MKYTIALLLLISPLIGCSEKMDRIASFTPPEQTGEMTRVDFKEKITRDETSRTVKVKNSRDNKFKFESELAGNPEFNQPLSILHYEHSVIGIDPPILPDGEIKQAKLKLKFKGGHGDFLLVTVDSIEFEKPWKKLTIIENEYSTLTLVTETILADGLLEVHIEAEDGHEFRLKESELKVVYYKPEVSR